MTLLKACRCGTPHPEGTTCPNRDRRRGNTTARGYGATWQRLARQAIAAQPWCTICGTTTDLTVDHHDPQTRGRTKLTLDDVDVLCRSHNSSKGAGGGRAVDAHGNADDPLPTFVDTHTLVG